MDESNKNLLGLNKSLINDCKKKLLELRKAISVFNVQNRRDREWLEKTGRVTPNKINDETIRLNKRVD